LSRSAILSQVRNIWLGYWSECDAIFGAEVKAKVQEAGLQA